MLGGLHAGLDHRLLVVGVPVAQVRALTFETYIFLIAYTAMLFLLCCLVFPTEISEYQGYRDYFMSRRAWFYGLLAATYLMDVVDT